MAKNVSILVINADVEVNRQIVGALQQKGVHLDLSMSGDEGCQRAAEGGYDLILLSLESMVDMSGLKALIRLRREIPTIPVVVIAEPEAPDLVTEAIRAGAYNWIAKPLQFEKLRSISESALENRKLHSPPVSLEGGLREEPGLKKIIGSSDKIQDVFKNIETVLHADVPVLILGETGTGKELVAKAIHWRGPRRRFTFALVNCAAIPETLLESELFGHEKGAFTGASELRKGRFELADRGTIFLDEIGEMSSQLQAKLLHVLEDGCFQRVGGNKTIQVDVRIISATNKNLYEEVEAGNFRQDLYYRLAVFPISLPSLRERGRDVPELANYFLVKYGEMRDRRVDTISSQAMEMLTKYHWPGNVRQLQNCIRRAILLSRDNILLPEHIDLPDSDMTAAGSSAHLAGDINTLIKRLQKNEVVPMHEVEETLIRQALEATDGNITVAAEKLGISRSTIYRKIQDYDIQVSIS